MIKKILILIILLTGSVYAISSTELIENSARYNNQVIEYQGEAIGDIMLRGNHAWVNINDGKAAIGIWMRKELAEKIKTLGDYKHQGDIVKVTGVFHRACKQHGGDLDIHAAQLTIIRVGEKVERPLQRYKFIWILILGIILILLLLLKR